MQWSPDSKEVAFVSTSRDHKREDMRIADAATGKVRNVLAERAETFFESGQGRVNWRYLPKSQRSPVVLAQGRLGASLSARRGHRPAEEPHHDRRRQRDAGAARRRRRAHDLLPGRRQGKGPRSVLPHTSTRSASTARGETLLTPEDGDHTIDLSPSGKYFVDTYSTPDVPPVSVVRDANGKVVVALETRRHLAARWRRAGSRRCRSR